MSRVSVGVGSYVRLTFHKMQASAACLAGVQMKFGLLSEFAGKITAIRDTGEKMENGKPDLEFDVQDSYGKTITAKRSNIAFCDLYEG